MPKLEPALTPGQWTERLRLPGRMVGGERLVGAVELVATSSPGNRLEMVSPGHGQFADVYVLVEDERHAVAAECLHGQPFGFWPELPFTLRTAAKKLRVLTDAPKDWTDLDKAADIIAALLPPED